MSARPHRRIFTLTLEAKGGSDAIRALRAALKLMLRRFGLRAVSVQEITQPRRRTEND